MFKTSYTAQNVADRIKRTFGDESGVQVTTPDIIGWINSAQLEICSKTDVLKGVANAVSVAGQAEYPNLDAQDAGINNIFSVKYKGIKLKFMSWQDFEAYVSENDPLRTTRATPEFWSRWGDQLSLFPTPESSGDAITVYFTALPAVISTLADSLSLPDNYFNRIVEHVLSSAYEMDENFGAHEAKLNQFDARLLTMGDEDEAPADDFYPVISVRAEDA